MQTKKKIKIKCILYLLLGVKNAFKKNDFTTNRKGFISYHKFNTDYFNIPAGDPQKSCLSPILFGMFVSDIPKPKGKEKLPQFTDDIVAWMLLKYLWENDLEYYVNRIVE